MAGKKRDEDGTEQLVERAERLTRKLGQHATEKAERKMGSQSRGFFQPRSAILGGVVAFLFLLCREAWRAHIQGVISPDPLVDPAVGTPKAVGAQHAGLRFVADLRAGTSLSMPSFSKRSEGPCTMFLCARSHVVRFAPDVRAAEF